MGTVDAETRSRIISRIRATETKMELAVKPILEALGFMYQPKGMTGKPDFAHLRCKVSVFLDGCFWHGCLQHYRAPKDNRSFWEGKIARNRVRDTKVTVALEAEGWRVIRVWEHDIMHLLT